jgi:tetratricopeptide (TPR) repeat protein
MRVIRLISLALVAVASARPNDAQQQDGIQAFKEGRYSVALARLQEATDPRSLAFLAMTKAAMGDCKAATPGLLAAPVSDRETYRLARIALAKCYSSGNEREKAFAVLDALAHEFPKDADVLYLSAKLHMKAFNDSTLAMFQRTPSSYRVHELSGEIFEVEDRYADAVTEYRKAIEVNPNASELHYRLGRAILLQSHAPEALNEAASEFRKELTLSPEDSACEFQLGQIAQVQGKVSEAAPHFERALELSPDFVQALIVLGKLKSQAKEYQAAIDLLVRATKLQPENETAHYTLLTAYRDSGQFEKAKAEKTTLDRLQKAPEGEFSEFLKKLGEKPPQQQ